MQQTYLRYCAQPSLLESCPALRIQCGNDKELQEDGDFVLYWMIANRRFQNNFSLQRAAAWAQALQKPLVVLEALRNGYRWASIRLHQFVIEGMAEHFESAFPLPITYYPYVERETNEGKGLLRALAKRSALVITDDFPCFMLPRMVKAAAKQLPVPLEVIDSNGIMPMRATERTFTVAHSFRRFLQKTIRPHLQAFPKQEPLADLSLHSYQLPQEILQKWPPVREEEFQELSWLEQLPIAKEPGPAPLKGGERQAQNKLQHFLAALEDYPEQRNHPDKQATSQLSSYLHFGHIASHDIFEQLMARECWNLNNLAEKPNGKREGWWGASPEAEAFLDQFITWRELGFNGCLLLEDYNKYESLPEWARVSMELHLDDERAYIYTLQEFEEALTHDPIWNAAQRQLRRDGYIHNYLRMLWGKKILEWTASPKEALGVMIELNNKYALDGRDPNSYSGIFWCLGRYDRAWGPERPVFGKIRYMSSESTRKKIRLKEYLEEYG